MPKFLIEASYTTEGTKGLLKDGGTKRRAAVEKLVGGLGGKLEAIYFALGDADVIILADMPDNASAAAVSVGVGATGSVRLKTTPLLTTEEMDKACKRTIQYTPPGA